MTRWAAAAALALLALAGGPVLAEQGAWRTRCVLDHCDAEQGLTFPSGAEGIISLSFYPDKEIVFLNIKGVPGSLAAAIGRPVYLVLDGKPLATPPAVGISPNGLLMFFRDRETVARLAGGMLLTVAVLDEPGTNRARRFDIPLIGADVASEMALEALAARPPMPPDTPL